MSLCYGWGDCNCWRCRGDGESPLAPAHVKAEPGDICGMSINGCKPFRVLVVASPEVNSRNELRAEVVILEENMYVKAGKRCQPLASTLGPLAR